ncbi:VOC family protein [Nesterenkonia muleiensis]|uniref:VOC family protein n=1 Tax=Nesterenkonia muleiensis TaxID=2282648 RepID=UPI000E71C4DF|nr:VOC family protein [Nesterenkonia muleiensis]
MNATTPHPASLSADQPSVWVTLQAHDAVALIDFYAEKFGFHVTVNMTEGDVVHHAELRWPDGAGGVMLGSYDPEKPWVREPGTAGVYVVTGEIDALYERVTSRGAEVFRPLTDTDYGSREFAVRDPEGNLWSFGTYLGEPRENA